MPHTDTIISLDHVTLDYENGIQALNDVSLQVRAGEHVCILGSNGSGKSTLASVVAGLLAPDAGTVTVAGIRGFDSERDDPIDFEAYRKIRRKVGIVFQNPDDQIVTTVVSEDVAFGPENLGLSPEEIELRVTRELKRVALTNLAQADPTHLSGGQKQRVAIAGALAMEPDIIVFDEPGALLDVRGRSSIMNVMGRLTNDGTTVLHITHFMDEALGADRVIVLDRSKVILEGTPDEVFSQRDVLTRIGLEVPFAEQIAAELDLPWCLRKSELCQNIMAAARQDQGTTLTALMRQIRGNANDEVVLEANHVSFSYGSGTLALDDISFQIRRNTLVAIVGQTGSGKSTLLRLLASLEAPTKGTIRISGIDTSRKRNRKRLWGKVGYVMQHPERQLFAETVIKDVMFGPSNLGLSNTEAEERARKALATVGLHGVEGASPFELSGGQQRLCALAGILAMDPTILVMDEPTAGLDPKGRQEIKKILGNVLAAGTTVVQVTHSMEDAAESDEVIVLDRAKIAYQGRPDEVYCPKNGSDLYQIGLGLPDPMGLALMLEDEGLSLVFDPLTSQELVDELVPIVGATRAKEVD